MDSLERDLGKPPHAKHPTWFTAVAFLSTMEKLLFGTSKYRIVSEDYHGVIREND